MILEIREKDSVSLLETSRKKEWDGQEARRKEQKNNFRSAQGLPPLSENDEDKDKSGDGESDDENVSGIMLNEVARILADYVEGNRRSVMVQ